MNKIKNNTLTFLFQKRKPIHGLNGNCYNKTVILFLLLLLVSHLVSAQNLCKEKKSFFSSGLVQVKENANYGLVFRGVGLNYGINLNLYNEHKILSYENKIGLKILFSKGIPGLGVNLKPLDCRYLISLPLADNNFFLGPGIKVEYDYYLYPDLQAGFDYWFTNISLGLNALYHFNVKNTAVLLKINSSLTGLVSRQPDYRDPYFYDLGPKHAIGHLHEELKLSSVFSYNTTDLEILVKPGKDSVFRFGYFLNYAAYNNAPDFLLLNYGIKLLIGKN